MGSVFIIAKFIASIPELQKIATLFDRNIKTIDKHINNALKEELAEFSTVANFTTVESINANNSVVAKFATVAANGKTYKMEH